MDKICILWLLNLMIYDDIYILNFQQTIGNYADPILCDFLLPNKTYKCFFSVIEDKNYTISIANDFLFSNFKRL